MVASQFKLCNRKSRDSLSKQTAKGEVKMREGGVNRDGQREMTRDADVCRA